MSAAERDRATQSREPSSHEVTLNTSAVIYAGTLVCRNASGLLVDGTDATALRFAGMALEGRSYAAGDRVCMVARAGCFKFASSGLAAGDVGKPVFLSDNQTVRLVGVTSYGILVGFIHSVVSATACWVELAVGTELNAFDVITERVPGAGVTVDSVLLKDGAVGSSGSPATNVTATTVTSDTIAEKTADAGVTADGVLHKDGRVVLTGLTGTPGAPTAAAGSAAGDAAALPAGTAMVYPVTGADGTKGVKINAADNVAGRIFYVDNQLAAVLKLYPPSGGSLNTGAADASVSSGSGKGLLVIARGSNAFSVLV